MSHNISDKDGSALIELKILQINTHMIRNGSVNLKEQTFVKPLLAALVAQSRPLVVKSERSFGIELFHLMQMICSYRKGPWLSQQT